MIPFNHLGWFFNLFAASAYPEAVIEALCGTLAVLPENASLLDLGAGTGIMSRYARTCRSDLECIAADPAEGMLRYVPDGIEIVNAKAETLPFAESSFDAVVLGEALHHFDEPHRALAEISRVIKEGGILFVYEFDPSTVIGGFICFAEKLLGEPGHFYAPEELKTLLASHGFAVSYRQHRWRYSLMGTFAAPKSA